MLVMDGLCKHLFMDGHSRSRGPMHPHAQKVMRAIGRAAEIERGLDGARWSTGDGGAEPSLSLALMHIMSSA